MTVRLCTPLQQVSITLILELRFRGESAWVQLMHSARCALEFAQFKTLHSHDSPAAALQVLFICDCSVELPASAWSGAQPAHHAHLLKLLLHSHKDTAVAVLPLLQCLHLWLYS